MTNKNIETDPQMPQQTMKLGFSGHETFPFRYTWLKKGMDAASKDPYIFNKDEAIVELGVGKNMVKSIRYWATAAGILEDHSARDGGVAVTSFGQKLLPNKGWDPYLEDPCSLWLIHWKLANNANKAAAWYYIFNEFTDVEFTKEQMSNELMAFSLKNHVNKTKSIIDRDVDCFLRTYTTSKSAKAGLMEDTLDCPLTELALIQELSQKGIYVLSREERRDIPDALFTYALMEFWANQNDRKDLPLSDIAYAHGSPGMIFKMDEDSIAYRLESLEKFTKKALRFDETAGLRRIFKLKTFDHEACLKNYYQNQGNLVCI